MLNSLFEGTLIHEVIEECLDVISSSPTSVEDDVDKILGGRHLTPSQAKTVKEAVSGLVTIQGE